MNDLPVIGHSTRYVEFVSREQDSIGRGRHDGFHLEALHIAQAIELNVVAKMVGHQRNMPGTETDGLQPGHDHEFTGVAQPLQKRVVSRSVEPTVNRDDDWFEVVT